MKMSFGVCSQLLPFVISTFMIFPLGIAFTIDPVYEAKVRRDLGDSPYLVLVKIDL